MSAIEAWDREQAERFVTEIFEHVLRVNPAPESQIAAWTARAFQLGDPVALFRAVVALPVHQQQLERDRDTQTRWPPQHFYSPLVSRSEARADRDRIFARKTPLGLDLRPEKQLEMFLKLLPFFQTLPFPETKAVGLRYFYDNPSYNFGDAMIYWAMLNHLRPRRIMEVGCGYSSALALDTIDLLGLPTTCCFIDPFPEVARETTAPLGHHEIVVSRVQDINPDDVRSLQRDDILFIDSSHVLKTGSDVHFELTELLPRLAPGVVIHFHDVFNGFEYPESWVLEHNHGWNEIYALRVFLMYNQAFEVEFFNHHFAKVYRGTINLAIPDMSERFLLNPGGGLWLRRC